MTKSNLKIGGNWILVTLAVVTAQHNSVRCWASSPLENNDFVSTLRQNEESLQSLQIEWSSVESNTLDQKNQYECELVVVDTKLRYERDGTTGLGLAMLPGSIKSLEERRSLTHNGSTGRYMSQFTGPNAPPIMAFFSEKTNIVSQLLKGDQEVCPLLACIRPSQTQWHGFDFFAEEDFERVSSQVTVSNRVGVAKLDPKHRLRLVTLSYKTQTGHTHCETSFEYEGDWEQSDIVPSGWQTAIIEKDGRISRVQQCVVRATTLLPSTNNTTFVEPIPRGHPASCLDVPNVDFVSRGDGTFRPVSDHELATMTNWAELLDEPVRPELKQYDTDNSNYLFVLLVLGVVSFVGFAAYRRRRSYN